MEQKLFAMKIKALSEADGSFDGLLSVYGVVDQVSDCVDRGAFTKTIRDNGGQVPMLWQHQTDSPIGMLTLQDTSTALAVHGQLQMALPDAQKAYILMKAKIVKGLSIGFQTIQDSIDDVGVRHLKEIRLFEGSVVTFPCLESALITDVKAAAAVELADQEKKAYISSKLAELITLMRSGL